MILLVTQCFPPDPGGIEALMGGIATHLAPVSVLADHIRKGGAEWVAPPFALRRFGGPKPLRRWHKAWAIRRRLGQGDITAIIADTWKSLELIPPTSLPVAVLTYGTEFPARLTARKRRRIEAALGRATRVIAISRYTADLVGPYVPPGRLAIINPPIPPQPEPSATALAEVAAQVAGRGPVLLTLARLEARKGIDQVIRALPGLRMAHPGILYLVAGGGEDEARLRALAAAEGVSDRVLFLGRVDEAAKAALYRSADLFVMPNRREGNSVEGYGLVFLEAGWHGLPSVAGRDGGAGDAVLAGETGLLCDGADAADVAATLGRLLGDAASLAEMGRKAQAFARGPRQWAEVAPQFLAALTGR
ncbi:phosphatidylinositol alpha-1,6-mannosyltransferase [Humitalea rosea]|uniref:Phosphatidylinositol alpha-1,6-mannosyltransferase n=1 Tax=Humitalea rosea TaxID=990373 RepID=A0A2W7KQ14_9PROT|nr:glycosyltransferase family 4 protein [Humitalea rosea]PZW50425.1 phosphatidylinositol alpha-1,6-mannosyltransferase [Humitalea rosea]